VVSLANGRRADRRGDARRRHPLTGYQPQIRGNHTGVERGWLGPWDHVRGNDTVSDGRLAMGRQGFFDEMLRFYGEFLEGEAPGVEDPAYAIQDSTGAWF
jgi:hypothetical protein